MIKPVKCKHCAEVIGERRQNDFRPLNSSWQKHKRSFAVECPHCHEWQMFPVNENNSNIEKYIKLPTAKKFSLQNV